MEYIRKVLQACNFPPWSLNTPQNKFNHKHNIHNGQTSTENQPSNNNSGSNNNKNISIVVPYIHGLGEGFKRTCNDLGIQVHFKRNQCHKNPSHGPQVQGQQTPKEWGHVQI